MANRVWRAGWDCRPDGERVITLHDFQDWADPGEHLERLKEHLTELKVLAPGQEVVAGPNYQAWCRWIVQEVGRFDAESLLTGLQMEMACQESRKRAALESGPKDRELSETERKILRLCKRKALKGERIALKVGVTYDHARRLLAKLRKEGRLKNTADGYRTM
jgi:hypothetical protein